MIKSLLKKVRFSTVCGSTNAKKNLKIRQVNKLPVFQGLRSEMGNLLVSSESLIFKEQLALKNTVWTIYEDVERFPTSLCILEKNPFRKKVLFDLSFV